MSTTILSRQNMWKLIRSNKEFTVKELAKAGAVSTGTARQYLKGLMVNGMVQEVKTRRFGKPANLTLYSLIKDVGQHAPQLRADGTEDPKYKALKNLWRSMRISKFFTIKELVSASKTTGCHVTERNATEYVENLLNAGYLKKSLKDGDQTTYVLIGQKVSGPMPPLIQRVVKVYDPNVCKYIGTED
ncbi:MAG: hypothetical protein OQJ95_01890 [Kangiella sp.]|nr:hypothetical protein [Kangiella sp.]MCW9029228.1 hypothetical protein [Kangiella sp.]